MPQQLLTPGFLYWDGFKYILTPGTFTPAGDLSGSALSQTVVGIQGNPIPGPSGTNTVLTWTGSALIWGSGNGISTIDNQGTPITGGPFSTLNFTGAGVVASNAGGGVATITIAGGGSSVTWANDLVNSSNTHQYVSSLSYNGTAGGGVIGINGTGTSLSFAANNTGPVITQASASGTTGATFTIQAQGNTTSNNGGALTLVGGTNTGTSSTPGSLSFAGAGSDGPVVTLTVGTDTDAEYSYFVIQSPFDEAWLTVDSSDFIVANAVTLDNLAGHGDGYVAVNNSGVLSWSAGTGGGGGGGNITLGTFVSRPPPGTAGALYYPTDGAINFISNGTAWLPIIDGTLGVQPPAAGTFTHPGFLSGTTGVDSHGAVVLTNGPNGDEQIQSMEISITPSTPYTLTAALKSLMWTIANTENANIGIGITDGTKFYILQAFTFCVPGGIAGNAGSPIYVTQYNNRTTVNTTPASGFFPYSGQAHIWMRIKNDGTNRTWQLSVNGVDWYILFTEAASTFVTESKVFFYIDAGLGNTQATQVILDSWSLTFP